MQRRNTRQEAIRQIVRTSPVRTQLALVEALREHGMEATQATVSRDVAQMGIRKLAEGGVYVLAEDLHLQRVLSEFVVGCARSGNLVVVRCQPETAQDVADALDDAELDGLLGAVADRRSVLVVAGGDEAAEKLCGLVEQLAGHA